MTAYRFCRTDDIALLADALNRCWVPAFPADPAVTPAAFKRSIRELQVWCSSCMVAFSGSDPIAVLIGARRASATLVHRIAVHPDHRRQGHGRHLLASLGSKLAILGPSRIVAEVPEGLAPARALFSAGGYIEEALLTDYVSQPGDVDRVEGGEVPGLPGARFVIPVTVGDLAANGLAVEAHPETCWQRSSETLAARKDEIEGLAVASHERIEAYLLYVPAWVGPEGRTPAGPSASASEGQSEHRRRRDPGGPCGERCDGRAPQSRQARAAALAEVVPRTIRPAAEVVSFRSLVEDGGVRLSLLLARLRRRVRGTLWLPKVHPAEISRAGLEALGFRPAGGHIRYAATARSD